MVADNKRSVNNELINKLVQTYVDSEGPFNSKAEESRFRADIHAAIWWQRNHLYSYNWQASCIKK